MSNSKQYNSLQTVATINQIVAYIILVVGIMIGIAEGSSLKDTSYGFILMLSTIVGVVLLFIVLLAISQFIMLMIDVATDTNNSAKNIYLIAEYVEKQKVEYENNNLENQKRIIELLSQIRDTNWENGKSKKNINLDEL